MKYCFLTFSAMLYLVSRLLLVDVLQVVCTHRFFLFFYSHFLQIL